MEMSGENVVNACDYVNVNVIRNEEEYREVMKTVGGPTVRGSGISSSSVEETISWPWCMRLSEKAIMKKSTERERVIEQTKQFRDGQLITSQFLAAATSGLGKPESGFRETLVNLRAQKYVQHLQEEYIPHNNDGGVVKICAENAVDIKTLLDNAGRVLMGKFLFCRTILPGIFGNTNNENGLMIVVEDISQDRVITLELHNFTLNSGSDGIEVRNCEEIIPCGSFLAIRNPKLSVKPVTLTDFHAVQVYNSPDQVELLSCKTALKMFPEVIWEPNSDGPTSDPYFWTKFGGVKDEEDIAVALSKLGNIAHKAGRHSDAIRWFNLALEFTSSNDSTANLLANRAAAFLRLRCHHRVLEDCNAALEKNGKHLMATTRKAKALIGLGKYEDAANFVAKMLEEAFKEFGRGKLKSLVNLEETARNLASEITKDSVDVDMPRLIRMMDSIDIVEDIIEFTWPMEYFEEGEVKGRGLRVTAATRPGQLLICSKAFALIKDSPAADLYIRIAYKIAYQPKESGVEFYKLFAGPELGYLNENSVKNQIVDMRRIKKVVQHNSFGTSISDNTSGNVLNSFIGIWALPSTLNHSCSDVNATWSHHKDILVVRAIKEIAKDEEIIISYVPPIYPLGKRMLSLVEHSFECHCRLCELDNKDEKTGVALERAALMNKLRSVGHFGNYCRSLFDTVRSLEDLRKSHPNLNACLGSDEVSNVVSILYENGEVLKSICLLEKIHKVEKEVGYLGSAAWTAVRLIQFCLTPREVRKEKARYWVKQLREDAIGAFGSVEALKVLVPEEFHFALRVFGIDLFESS